MTLRSSAALMVLLAALAGCVEGTQNAVTTNSSGGSASGTILPRGDGGFALSFTTAGQTCTASYNRVVPGGTEVAPVRCTGDGSGNATLIYAADGSPDRATFGGLGIGSGTLVF
ncbi:hypothetical protein [Pelagovum pacificum]|uniref:Uncharacterized protein n=1 Tax=Pelagovum pacificum TaxID=2588711 RepID=A0A5C5GCM8_9RHOB|nr:hypothetical protein [Pelagovum pacificum]QQA41289.1 hypothetical protein I8N54_10640 [Pelagovum pacificum]TNY31904.1 hypothetical protein FHY64_00955 [Pelagovum pacificum]